MRVSSYTPPLKFRTVLYTYLQLTLGLGRATTYHSVTHITILLSSEMKRCAVLASRYIPRTPLAARLISKGSSTSLLSQQSTSIGIRNMSNWPKVTKENPVSLHETLSRTVYLFVFSAERY